MKIFLAGATGVIGVRLLRLMATEGHVVAAMTRTPGKVEGIRADGATPIVCDLFDAASLNAAVREFRPDLIMHQVTDLPDDLSRLAEFVSANNRIRKCAFFIRRRAPDLNAKGYGLRNLKEILITSGLFHVSVSDDGTIAYKANDVPIDTNLESVGALSFSLFLGGSLGNRTDG